LTSLASVARVSSTTSNAIGLVGGGSAFTIHTVAGFLAFVGGIALHTRARITADTAVALTIGVVVAVSGISNIAVVDALTSRAVTSSSAAKSRALNALAWVIVHASSIVAGRVVTTSDAIDLVGRSGALSIVALTRVLADRSSAGHRVARINIRSRGIGLGNALTIQANRVSTAVDSITIVSGSRASSRSRVAATSLVAGIRSSAFHVVESAVVGLVNGVGELQAGTVLAVTIVAAGGTIGLVGQRTARATIACRGSSLALSGSRAVNTLAWVNARAAIAHSSIAAIVSAGSIVRGVAVSACVVRAGGGIAAVGRAGSVVARVDAVTVRAPAVISVVRALSVVRSIGV